MKPGLADLPNAVIVPHIASASMWTRSGMVRGASLGGGAVWQLQQQLQQHLKRRLVYSCNTAFRMHTGGLLSFMDPLPERSVTVCGFWVDHGCCLL